MKVPLSWLKEYVDVTAAPQEIAAKLTASGSEVGGVETIGSDYNNVVVAEILSVAKHPNADKLRLCRVNDGTSELGVVCGAPNCAAGQRVVLAKIGAKLPGGLKIEKAKIRGEPSEGMLCAADELGLSSDHSGIMVLSNDVAVGTPFSVIAGPPDTVFSIDVTWNRPDCLSIIGMAREVAAVFGLKLKMPPAELTETSEPVESLVKVSIEDATGCPRYTARVMRNVKLGESPEWMKKRLTLCGVRPINNVVDITNYVMLECGQPLHAFDYTLLENREIIVRKARPGEKMATLDAVERQITAEMLVIADGKKPVALAGVMGGAGSEINESTGTVLLESACFHPPLIRKTSSKLNLSTESSHRYERSVDVGGVEWASRRAASLMAQFAGASVCRGVIDVYPGKQPERRVKCRYQRIRDLIGIDISNERTDGILKSLELPVVEKDAHSCIVSVPSFRPDIELEADLIEEVSRVHGLDSIPADVPVCRVVPDMNDRWMQAISACRSNLLALGLTEIMHYSFLSKKLLDTIDASTAARRVVLPNPVSSDYAIMRDSLLPQLVETLGRNLSRQVESASFFEIGKVFFKGENGKPAEENRLSLGLMGKVARGAMDGRRALGPDEMFLWMKGLVGSLLSAQHLAKITFERSNHPVLEDGYAISVKAAGVEIGSFGLLKSSIRREWRMIEAVAVAEFVLAKLTENTFILPVLKPIPVYPAIRRDVAVVVDEALMNEDVIKIIWKNAPRELTAVELFDIFRSEVVGRGKKSLAYSLVYRSLEKTLTDSDANGHHDRIKEILRKEFGAEIREN